LQERAPFTIVYGVFKVVVLEYFASRSDLSKRVVG
jgi:hypothetical protein